MTTSTKDKSRHGQPSLKLAAPLLASLGLCAALLCPAGAFAQSNPCSGASSAIPERAASAPDASAFVGRIASMGEAERDAAIKGQLLSGNVPSFLRQALPESYVGSLADGQRATITLCVLPDYLSVGSDRDHILVPMALDTALIVAAQFGFSLPTRRMVDMIYSQSQARLSPQPLPAGDQMRSTAYYVNHNGMVQRQQAALGLRDGMLTAGHKKDVVLSPKLWQQPGQEAIYGWHRASGDPIQPLSSVHGMRYADYSHGIRLVSQTVYVNGLPHSVYEILADKRLSTLLSDEGPLPLAPAAEPRARQTAARAPASTLALKVASSQ